MRMVLTAGLCLLAMGCASGKAATVLAPAAGTKAEAATQIDKGNALFGSRDFAGAENAFRQALTADAGSAEAHYNLALTLDRTGRQAEARKHYMEAANLAPGNKVIWDSPPLREKSGGLQHNIEKKSYLDPSPRAY